MRQSYFDHPSRSHNRPSSAKLPSLVEIESRVIDHTDLCQTAHMIDDSLNQASLIRSTTLREWQAFYALASGGPRRH